MDYVKIGNFIAECRKDKNLTQLQLADMLNITDRAVSKWERAKGLPDTSIMLQLCEILGITVNELLRGEKITMKEYDKKAEETILEMAKREEEYNKRLLFAMYAIGGISTVFFLAIYFIAALFISDHTVQLIIIISALVLFLIGIFTAVKFESDAGYYECRKCHHKLKPTFKEVVVSSHLGTTRHLKCPQCGKRTWHKKVAK